MAGELITVDGQIEWNGVLLGCGTPYVTRELEGWDDLPGLDLRSAVRPSRHGAWPGIQLAEPRAITWVANVTVSTVADLQAAVKDLRAAVNIANSSDEAPLVIRLGGETTLTLAQVTRRLIPTTPNHAIGAARAVVQWTASDPRRFSLAEHSLSIPAPSPGTGLTYPLLYPLDYGTPGWSGAATVVNAGDTPTSPRLVVSGPCSNPLIVNASSGRQVQFAVTLVAGEQLVVDTHAGSVLLGAADRLYTLTAGSVPVEDFELAPGSNAILFRAVTSGPGAQLAVAWRDAWM